MGLHPDAESDRACDLHERIRSSILSVEEILANMDPGSSALAGYSLRYREKIALVRALVDSEDPLLVPQLAAGAPRGHAFSQIEESLDLPLGGGIDALEELANLGILRREFWNKVNLCPRCAHCQINFRETCPTCEGLELDVERILHHFPCAYQGLESEFQKGLELVCPKCMAELRQIGQDFERPHEVHVCHAQQHVFEEPDLQGQCLNCEHLFSGTQIEVAHIHSYRPTPLAVRAVELNRLTGLDVSEILYDSNLKLASRDFLDIEIRRELIRVARYGGSFVTAALCFEYGDRLVSIFRELSAASVKQLGGLLVDSLRNLDLVARTGDQELGLFLVETDDAGAEVVRGRIFELLEELDLVTITGREIRPRWRSTCWDDGKANPERILGFYASDGVDA